MALLAGFGRRVPVKVADGVERVETKVDELTRFLRDELPRAYVPRGEAQSWRDALGARLTVVEASAEALDKRFDALGREQADQLRAALAALKALVAGVAVALLGDALAVALHFAR